MAARGPRGDKGRAGPPREAARPRRAGGKKKGGGKGRSSGWRGQLRQALRWLAWRLSMLVLGAALGLAAISGILYRQALDDVDALLLQPVWTRTGRVLSGPVELWPGLSLTAEELAADLQRSGFARVPKVAQDGDFELSADGLKIRVPAAEGSGWKTDAGEQLVSFRDGRVSLAGGKSRLRLPPAELAQVRGPDNEARRPVALADIPDHVVDAVLAMEDARFRQHEGLDPLGIARALLVNAVKGSPVQGGSTLTQQTVKNLFLSQERTVERKAREALLAVALEQRRSKDQILELYLNEIYLGQVDGASVCGVDQAARAWFGKPVDRLDLGEAATIAGTISAPNRYSPLKHPEAAIERRNLALDRMVEVGWLEAARAASEKERPLQVHPVTGGRRAPWAVDAAIDLVEGSLGEGTVAAQGVTVQTTIQPALQRLAERAVAEAGAELDAAHPKAAGAEIALVAVRVKDGAIVALVGGRGYGDSQFDRASHARRQIGSTVKPLTWLFAFEADPALSPATVVQDEPIERVVDGKAWKPTNYDRAFLGPVSLREALVHSRNVPAVLVAERVGMKSLLARWRGLGLSTATDWPSAALGSFGATPVELAGAYTVFPGKGMVSRPRLVLGATDQDGVVLIAPTAPTRERAAGATAAFLAQDILREVLSRGTGRRSSSYGVKGEVGGKTGTTDDARDAWFAGYSSELAVVVWVGFDRDRALGLTGGEAALPAWSRFMAASGTLGVPLPGPVGVSQVEVCRETGRPTCTGALDRQDCGERVTDWFRDGQAPECERESLIDRIKDGLGGGQDGEAQPDAPTEKKGGLFRKRR